MKAAAEDEDTTIPAFTLKDIKIEYDDVTAFYNIYDVAITSKQDIVPEITVEVDLKNGIKLFGKIDATYPDGGVINLEGFSGKWSQPDNTTISSTYGLALSVPNPTFFIHTEPAGNK